MTSKRLVCLNQDLKQVIAKYPDLRVHYINNWPYKISGRIEIFDTKKVKWGEFLIMIPVPPDYPNQLPEVYEISEIIPRIADRHMYPKGQACLTARPNEILVGQRGIRMIEFLDEYVIPFFANQIYFQSENKWANGEYSHGSYSIVEFFCQLFTTDKLDVVLRCLIMAIERVELPLNGKCLCGENGFVYEKCHWKAIEHARLIGIPQLIKYYSIANYYRLNPGMKPVNMVKKESDTVGH